MKLVYSLNSAPYKGDFRRNFGNWPKAKIEWIIALRSIIANKKYFDTIEIVTDEIGKKFLEETGLATHVNNIKVALNIEKPFDKLWCLGKIQTFALQQEDFCHIDFDAWIQRDPFELLKDVQIAAQSSENGLDFYKETWGVARRKSKIPFFRHSTVDFKASNTAFYWCKDLSFNEKYTNIALEMLEEKWFQKEASKREYWDMTQLAVLQEQLVFGELHYRIYNREPIHLLDIENNGFVHVFGAKNNHTILNTLESQTRFLDPIGCAYIDEYFKFKN